MNPVLRISIVTILLCLNPAIGKMLRSAAEPDYPPFSMVTPEGEVNGFAVDLLKAATEAMGLDVEFKSAPWNEIKNQLAKGELDVLPLVGRTPERETLFDFTVPYMTLHGALFVREDESRIQRLDDLTGKRIAVMKGDNAEEYVLRAKLSDQIISTTTFEEAFSLLSSGEADAVIAQKLMGISLLKELGIGNIKVVGKPNEEFKQDFCFAVQKGNAELLAELNEGLAIVNAKGIRQQLQQKWMSPFEYETAQARILLFGGDHNYPPFEFLDEKGRPAGFNIDLARALAKETGVEISFQLLPWSEVRHKAVAGEIDMACMLYSEGRDQTVDYSVPLLASAQAVFARNDSPPYQSFEDLKAYRVSVQDGDLAHDFALEHGLGGNLTVTKGPQEALKLLAEGKVDFSLGALLQGRYRIKENGWKNLRAVEPPLYVTDYCFAVPAGRTELLNLLNAGLLQLKTSGEYRQIYNEWLGPLDSTWTRQKFRSQLLTGAATLLLLAALPAIWIFALRRQVHKKTKSLHESEERYRLVFATAGDAMFLLNQADGTILESNEAASAMYGYSSDEFRQLKNTDLSAEPEKTKKAINEELQVAPVRYHRRKDGTTFPVEIKATYSDQLGQRVSVVNIRDISERMQTEQVLRESEAKQAKMVANIGDVIVIIDQDGINRYKSPNITKLFGWQPEDVVGRSALDLVHPDDMDQATGLIGRLLEKPNATETTEVRYQCKDGTYRWINFTGTNLVHDPDIRGILGNYHDITDRKEAEEALKGHNYELQRFNKAAVGREIRMVELKKQVNTLCREIGRSEPYSLFNGDNPDPEEPNA